MNRALLTQLRREFHPGSKRRAKHTLAAIEQLLIGRRDIMRFLRLTKAFARLARTTRAVKRDNELLRIRL